MDLQEEKKNTNSVSNYITLSLFIYQTVYDQLALFTILNADTQNDFYIHEKKKKNEQKENHLRNKTN